MINKLFLMFFLLSSSLYSKTILISFDGSEDLNMWKDTLEFAKDNNIKFTYFISAPYFVTKSELNTRPYWALTEIGKPNVNFRNDSTEKYIIKRKEFLMKAQNEGHEIASHLCGHYNGAKWTYEQWNKELKFFQETFKNVPNITGIRAPELGVNKSYFKAIKQFGYEYDSSLVYSKNINYEQEIPIRAIKTYFGNYLPFDYNFSLLKLNPDESEELFFISLCEDYVNNTNPTQICLHFKNFVGQPYYKAMKRFVLWVKDKNPSFLTYKEFYRLDKKS